MGHKLKHSARRHSLLLLCLLLLPVRSALAAREVEPQLRALFAKLPDPNAIAGVCVIELTHGQTVFAQQADQPLVPASTMKVFVMAAGLAELGADFEFDTQLVRNGPCLVVVGDGDPGFGDEKIHKSRGESIGTDFERWADTLTRLGLHQVTLGLDESIFDDQRVHPSWEAGDLDNWYAAPIGALNFNDNCVDITVTPARKPGTAPTISFQPECSVVRIVNACRSGGKGDPVLHHRSDSFVYEIRGHCPTTAVIGPASFPDPGLLFGDSFRTVLRKKGINVDGEVGRQRIRSADGQWTGPWELVDRRQTPIADVLRRIGKDSQNLFADCLLKRVGFAWARRGGQQVPLGSWSTGAAAVHELVGAAGIAQTGLQVADGSGLSRDNRCTARQLAAMLAWMHHRPEAELFRQSLSVAGADGSLRKRLKDMRGDVYCKTGTMRGVRSLAGYVVAEDGRMFAFASIFNGYKGTSNPYKDIQDRLCRILSGEAGKKVRRR